MMGRWYRLQHTVDAYDSLHNAELTRLKRRREEAVGPTERRISRIRYAIESFAVGAYLDFGEMGHRVPNGDITSRPVIISIEKDDKTAHDWMKSIDGLADAIELRPWIDMKKLRTWIDARVRAGHLQRMVSRPAPVDEDVEFWLVDEAKGWPWQLAAGDVGVWFWTEAGGELFDQPEGEVLRGVTWEPNGTMGSGRNFKIKL